MPEPLGRAEADGGRFGTPREGPEFVSDALIRITMRN